MNLANKISIIRMLLIRFFVGSIIYYKNENRLISYLPFIIFLIAVITDGVDGFIARKFKQKTELGTIIDPLADKLLLITAFLCLSFSKSIPINLRLPAWLPIIVISRDIIIVLGAIIIHIIKGRIHVIPTMLGKITTFLQMLTILSVLVKFPYSFLIWNLTGILTVMSGIHYIMRGSGILNENNA